MHHAEMTESVRRQIAQVFAHLGDDSAAELRESILICDGAYCGRRFVTPAGGQAVWFVEENELKFYDAAGSVLSVLTPTIGESRSPRIAA